MSAEIVAIVLSAVGLLLTQGGLMFAGFAWCIRRSDAIRADLVQVERSLGTRIDAVRTDLADVERSLGARIDAVSADTTELKVAMARLEGPQRHLIVASR